MQKQCTNTCNVAELIERCERNDACGWEILFALMERVCRKPLLCKLSAWSIDASFADDILHDLYIYVQEDIGKIRAFRGKTHRSFRAFLSSLAVNFASNQIQKMQRARAREKQYANLDGMFGSSGPIESEVLQVLWELEASLPKVEHRKLCTVSDFYRGHCKQPDPHPPQCNSPRTLRHWKKQLFNECMKKVDC